MQKAVFRGGADSILGLVEALEEAEHLVGLPRGQRPAPLVEIRPHCLNAQRIEEQPPSPAAPSPGLPPTVGCDNVVQCRLQTGV